MQNMVKSAFISLPLAVALSGCFGDGGGGSEPPAQPNVEGRFLLGSTAKAV